MIKSRHGQHEEGQSGERRRLIAAVITVVLIWVFFGGPVVVVLLCSVFRTLGWNVSGAMYRARQAEADGNLDEALRWSNRAVARDPSFCEAYSQRGRIYEAMGEPARAIDDYSQAIDLAPYLFEYYIDRGRVREKLGQVAAAAGDYAHALLADPDSLSGPQMYAEQRAERSGPETVSEMIAVFDEAIERNPNDESLRKGRWILISARRFPHRSLSGR